jgi:hypothetical protein
MSLKVQFNRTGYAAEHKLQFYNLMRSEQPWCV